MNMSKAKRQAQWRQRLPAILTAYAWIAIFSWQAVNVFNLLR